MPPRRRNSGLFPLKPLRSPTSRVLLRCYAREGRNWHAVPVSNVPLLFLLIDPITHAWRWEPGSRTTRGPWCCEAVQAPWRILGWLPADGSLPRGEPDEVDPGVARIEFCIVPDRHQPHFDTPAGSHSGPTSYVGSTAT